MNRIFLFALWFWGCSSEDQTFLNPIEGRWIEKTSKQFYFEEWHALDDGVWGGFSYVLPKKELQRIKRMRSFRVKKHQGNWIFLEISSEKKEKIDTLILQASEEPNTWIFKKEGREEMIRMDGNAITRNSVFPKTSVLHHLNAYQPKVIKEELPYSLLK